MKKLMTHILILFGFLFIVSSFIFGNIPAVKAEDTPTVEGVWEFQSSFDGKGIGGRYTIVRKDEGYNVIFASPNAAGSNTLGLYYGSPTQIMTTTTPSYDELVHMISAATSDAARSCLGQAVGKVTYRHRITISPDGLSAKDAEDKIIFSCDETGRFINYEIEPFANISTLVRIAPPVDKTSSAFAQVESRGEFYFLTKDGRKLTGEDVSKVPLEEGTKVATGNDGHVKMTLPDNTTFTVGPNSDLVIDKFVYDPDKSPEKIMATMTKGVFRWVTGKTSGGAAVYKDPAQMKVNLPVVAVGIRGTDFEATVAPDGSGSIVLNFGQLEITEKKTGFTFILNAGEKITFSTDGSVSRPMKVN